MEISGLLKAIRIEKEIETLGSAPLFVTAENDIEYFAKPIRTNSPCLEIINEIFCSRILFYWGLSIPESCFLKIDYSLTEGKNLSKRYKQEYFEKPFFASQNTGPNIEIETYFGSFSKTDLNKFESPEDLIKIGFFDIWVGNKDRKPSNPNMLISEQNGLFRIHPIDHGAAFCFLEHKEINEARLWMEANYSILTTGMAKVIAKDLFNGNPKLFWAEHIEPCLENSLAHIDEIFDSIPKSLGCSKKAKVKIKNILFDDKRNSELWGRALSLLG